MNSVFIFSSILPILYNFVSKVFFYFETIYEKGNSCLKPNNNIQNSVRHFRWRWKLNIFESEKYYNLL